MQPIAFKRHRFPPDVIRYAVWLYFRFRAEAHQAWAAATMTA